MDTAISTRTGALAEQLSQPAFALHSPGPPAARRPGGYDYAHHGRAGTPSADLVPDGVIHQLCPLGRRPRL